MQSEMEDKTAKTKNSGDERCEELEELIGTAEDGEDDENATDYESTCTERAAQVLTFKRSSQPKRFKRSSHIPALEGVELRRSVAAGPI